MKKIIISLSLIGAVAAIAVGTSLALFSDTETSTGNILVAGSMDLKVDHKFASYDGNDCTKDCVPDTKTNLVINGGFELPVVVNAAKWDIFPSVAGNWTVLWRGDIPATDPNNPSISRPAVANLELHRGVLGPADEGQQYAELDTDWYGPSSSQSGEPASVKIYQDIVTVPGAKYQINFAFAPRPNTSAADNVLEVKWDGVVVDTIGPLAGGGSIVWSTYSYNVTASGALTRVEFTDLGTANSLGTFLDDVKVHPENCSYQITGGTCTLWDLKDLGTGDFYWNYSDVKPGDYGTNIISLHAYDNDAYACIITHNIIDNENDLIEPEANAGDITPAIGELSQFINVFAWEDTTQNNVYDLGEPIIAGPNSPLADAIGRIPLTASHTKYIGIDWCAGTQSIVGGVVKCDGSGNQNVAQTDSLTASITAYAEQQRNNEGFNCATVQLTPAD